MARRYCAHQPPNLMIRSSIFMAGSCKGNDPGKSWIIHCQDQRVHIQPSLARSSLDFQSFYINNRSINSKPISLALRDGYGTLLPRGRFPIAVLKIYVDTREVDVNVHPLRTRSASVMRGYMRYDHPGCEKCTFDAGLDPRYQDTFAAVFTIWYTRCQPFILKRRSAISGLLQKTLKEDWGNQEGHYSIKKKWIILRCLISRYWAGGQHLHTCGDKKRFDYNRPACSAWACIFWTCPGSMRDDSQELIVPINLELIPERRS